MRTWTGSMAPFGPDAEPVNILDLVMHLGREVRWGGFGSKEYTVLHHSMLVALIWLRANLPKEGLVHILLHDFHEAYTGDIPSPVKAELGDAIKKLEAKIDTAIYAVLHRGMQPDDETRYWVHICDQAALKIESHFFSPPRTEIVFDDKVKDAVAKMVKTAIPELDQIIAARRNYHAE